jgi:hypothetical protein
MSADNVTPICDPAQVVYQLAYDLDSISAELPIKEFAPSFVLQPETQAELNRAILLLREVTRLVQRAVDRESPRWDAHEELAEVDTRPPGVRPS